MMLLDMLLNLRKNGGKYLNICKCIWNNLMDMELKNYNYISYVFENIFFCV